MSYSKTSSITNRDVAHLLRSVAAAYLIKNKNRFRIIAYENAADAVEHLTREVRDLWEEGKLDTVPAIGSTIASALDEYFRKGRSNHFDAVFKGIPLTVFELMKVSSIGPKRAYKLAKHFNLKNSKTVFADVRSLCEKGEIAKLPTFGEKSQEVILRALDLYERRKEATTRMPLPYAYLLAEDLITYLRKNKKVRRADALGSLRRMVATIGDIDIAVVVENKYAREVIDHFLKYPKKISVDSAGKKKASIIISPQIRIDLRVQSAKDYGAMLQYFTGSKTHNIKLREYALKKGYSLSEYGIKDLKKNTPIRMFDTEEKFYRFLGLSYIPPEIREGTDEIELSEKNRIPKLIEVKDIKGDFHVHSNYDLKPSHDLGINSYREICTKAKELGYQYIGFSDHNPKTSGQSEDAIVKIMAERRRHIEKSLLKIDGLDCYVGLEVDILPGGDIALPKKALNDIDYMIISVHSVFGMDRKSMTKRVLAALENPKVKILGHPTGRLLQKREGYELEWEKIFEVCKKKQIALEINSWPDRLDLPDTLIKEALRYGVKCIVNTDAHANVQMELMSYGVSVARRGWATKNDIINTRDPKEFRRWMFG